MASNYWSQTVPVMHGTEKFSEVLLQKKTTFHVVFFRHWLLSEDHLVM